VKQQVSSIKASKIKFGEIAVRRSETRVPSQDEVDLYVGLEHLQSGSYTVDTTGSPTELIGGKTIVSKGDILFARRNTYLRRVAICPIDGFFSPDGYAITSKSSACFQDYLFWIVASDAFLDYSIKWSAGTHSKRVKWSDLENFETVLPPLEEQVKISKLLWSIENYKRNLKSSIQISQELTAVAIDKWIEEAGGEESIIEEALEVARGGSPRPIDDYFTDKPEGLNWIKIGDVPINGKYIDSTKQKIRPEGLSKTRQVRPGDLVLSNSMSFGRPYIVNIHGCIHDGWLSISDPSGRWEKEYLYFLFRSSFMQSKFLEKAGGSTVKNLNSQLVNSIEIKVPSLEAQREFIEKVNSLEMLTQNFEAEVATINSLQRTMLDNLLGLANV
jgi:type I restriction enzyme S subunit